MSETEADPDEETTLGADDPADSGLVGGEGDLSGDESVGSEETESLRAERDKYLNMARRTQAEFENYQKRIRRDWETERKYSAQPVLMDLLPVLDNLERALQALAQDESAAPLIEGIQLVHKQWLEVFSKHGAEQIKAEGEPFDPNLHEAVMQQPSAEYPPMSVLNCLRSGYLLHDRVLRPAQVIVSSAPPAEE